MDSPTHGAWKELEPLRGAWNEELPHINCLVQRTRCPCKTIITSRRTSMLFKTDVSAHRAFLNETTRNGGLKNFMYAITQV